MKPLVLEAAAEADIADAADWYAAHHRSLAVAFLREIDRTLSAVQRNPQQFPIMHRDIRRALVNRFPYGLFFRVVSSGDIVVLACLHAKRDPRGWQSRA